MHRQPNATVIMKVSTKQLAFFIERKVKPRRLNDATRITWNVTEHPTGEWTAHQFRSFLTGDAPYRFIVHDRDAVFSPAVDTVLQSMNLRVLKTPARVPQANAVLRAPDRDRAPRMSRPSHSAQ
jgi:putative transposase